MWPYIGLRDFLRIEKTSFYGYGGYVYEIVDKESSGIIVVIQVSYYLMETSMLWLLWLSWLLMRNKINGKIAAVKSVEVIMVHYHGYYLLSDENIIYGYHSYPGY